MTQLEQIISKHYPKCRRNLNTQRKVRLSKAFSKYADLASVYDAIKKPLVDNWFVFTFMAWLYIEDGQQYVETSLMHESGGVFKNANTCYQSQGDMMGLGSAITYAKRYGISMIVGLGLRRG